MLRVVLAVGFLALLGCRTSSSQQAQQLQDTGELFFSISPHDHTVDEGKNVTLRCEAEPRGMVRYSWKVDDQPLAPSPRRHQRDGDLVITRVNRMLDSGSFVCVAEHLRTDASIESSPAKLNIQWISEASVVLQQPKPAPLIRPGGKVELRCHVDGSGELRYDWFRNTKKVVETNRLQSKRNVLVIDEVNTEDNGIYHCLGRNSVGPSPLGQTFPLIVPSNVTATLRVAPQKVTVRRGESASFSCVFDNVDRIQWYFDDRMPANPIETDDDRSVFDNGTLVIHRVYDNDRGIYSCHGVRGDGPAQIYTAELQIAYIRNLTDTSFEPYLPDQTAVVGEHQELQVSCLAPPGLPPPKIFWKDPQGRIISDSGAVRVQDDTLVISKTRPDAHQGRYTCVAENMAGYTEISVQVVVSWPPELRSSPRPVSAQEDDLVSMSCTYTGMEPPVTQTRWLKDGEPVSQQHRVHDLPGNSTLILRNVQPSDRGMYACEITTKGFGPIRSEAAQLGVKEKLKFSPEPVSKHFELNSTAKVSCKAQGLTPPTFKWYKNGAPEFPRHVSENNGTLHFAGVLETDKGNYTCVAKNSQGQINHTITIDVVIAPKFTIKPENASVLEGVTVVLECAAEGDPTPAIRWDKNSQMITSNDPSGRFEILSNGSLYFSEVYQEDQASYGCTAGNSGGFKREEIYLTVKGRDGYRLDFDDGSDDGSMMTKTVIITLGAATAYMVLVIGLMLYCRYRRRRRKQRHLQEQVEGQDKAENAEVQEEQCELRETNLKANSSGRKKRENRESHRSGDGTDTAHSQASNHSKKSKSSYDKLVIPRACLHQDMKPLGRGEFGDIFSTKYRPAIPASEDASQVKESIVMVKVLNNSKDESILTEFKRHLDFLRKLNHENVARLVGLVRDEEPDYMVLEYTDWGDLKQYLVASKSKETSSDKPSAPQLTVPQILSLANQAARGLKHVSDHRLVHKDVAARNCLISSNLTLKVSMSCMTKEPHHQEYTKHRNQLIPLRWMPKEAVLEDEYSTKSDVYSYSCLLWEMFHQGELPFKKLNDASIIEQLRSQSLAWQAHKAAPPALQEMQTKCWSYDPRERPTFDYIVSKLQEIMDAV